LTNALFTHLNFNVCFEHGNMTQWHMAESGVCVDPPSSFYIRFYGKEGNLKGKMIAWHGCWSWLPKES